MYPAMSRRSRATPGRSSTPAMPSNVPTRSICFRTRRTSRRWWCSIGARDQLGTWGDSSSTPFRCFDESLEECTEFAGPEKVLRVPLHAEAEARIGILDDLDHSVRRGRRHHESTSDLLHRLVMAAVHLERLVNQPLAHQLGEQRILVHPHLVRQLVRLMLRHRKAVSQRTGDL